MIRQLTEKQKQFIQLYAVEGKKIAEIVRILNVPKSTVYQWSHDEWISAKLQAAREKALALSSEVVRKHFAKQLEPILAEYDKLIFADGQTNANVKARAIEYALKAIQAQPNVSIQDDDASKNADVFNKITNITDNQPTDIRNKIIKIVNE